MADESSKAHAQRLEAINDAQQTLAKYITRASDANLSPDAVRPQPGQQRLQRRLHLAAINYWSEMSEFRDRAHTIWGNPLPADDNRDDYEVEVPDPSKGVIDTQSSDTSAARASAAAHVAKERRERRDALRDESTRPQFHTAVEKVRLGDLGKWEERYITYPRPRRQQHQGIVEERVSERLTLPLRVCRGVYRALNDVRDMVPNIGPDIGEMSYVPGEDEVLRLEEEIDE